MKIKTIAGLFLFLHASIHLVQGHGDEIHARVFEGDPYSPDGCDEVRGCFSCVVDGCEGLNTAWEPDPDENVIKFTVWGPLSGDTGHVSMGISQDDQMFEADVYSCITDGGSTSLKRYWTPASPGRGPSPRTPLKGVTLQEIMVEDGEMHCQFNRNMFLNDNDPEFYNISGNQSFHILLASANSLNGGEIDYHMTSRGASQEVILSEISSAEQRTENKSLMKAHGSLMVIAWLGLASIGITMARYFKPMWPNTKFGGVQVWFAVHRACMVTALLLCMAAFITIFFHVDGFIVLSDSADSKRRFAHAILGVIAQALGFLNPIMAIFRPHPGTPKRPIFNWAHWAVGTSGLVIAMTTIALALAPIDGGTILPGLEEYTFWAMIGFIGFHFLIWIILDVLKCTTDSAGRTDDIPLSGKADGPQPVQDDSSPSGSRIKNIILFIYTLGAAFIVIFLVVHIAIA